MMNKIDYIYYNNFVNSLTDYYPPSEDRVGGFRKLKHLMDWTAGTG
jgi:hypothetical protein